LVIIIGLIFFLFDFLGLKRVADKYSSNSLNAIFGAWYDHSFQNKITILFFDDEAVKHFDGTWPASYAFHANVLTALRESSEPRAVLIDLLFHYQRNDESINTLIHAIRAYNNKDGTKSGSIPVFLALAAPSVWSREGIREEFIQLAAEENHVHLVRVPRELSVTESDRYPFVVDETGREPEDAERRDRASRAYPSAAWSMYQELCLSDVQRGKEWGCREPLIERDRRRDDTFEVIWARGTLPVTRAMYENCKESQSLLRAWIDILLKGLPAIQDRCPYAESIHLRAFFDPWRVGSQPQGEHDRAHNPALDDEDREVRIDFDGKVVMYAASLGIGQDTIVPPTHDRPLPGVHLHAMALDNLLTDVRRRL